MGSSHELPLTAHPPSFALISLLDWAGSEGMEPSCTVDRKKIIYSTLRAYDVKNFYQENQVVVTVTLLLCAPRFTQNQNSSGSDTNCSGLASLVL